MELTHAKSVDHWVKTVRAHPIWAIYNGFLPDDFPGVGKLLHHYDIGAIIDLNQRNTGNISCKGDISFTKDGIPICSEGHIMAYNGYCYDRQRHKWRCPKSRKNRSITCNNPCSSLMFTTNSALIFASLFSPGLFPISKFPFPATRAFGDVRESGEVLRKIFLAPET